MPYRTSAASDPPPPAPPSGTHGALTALALTGALTGFMLAVVACPPPDPPRGVVTVAFGPSLDNNWTWTAHQLEQVVPYVNVEMDRLGYDFRVVSEADAEVVVRMADRLNGACELYHPGLRYFEVDPTCAQGDEAVKRATAHGLMHYLTYSRWGQVVHLCTWAVNDPVPPMCHPRILCADCVASPGLAHPDDQGPQTMEAYVPPLAISELEPRDIELIATCAATDHCF